MSRKISRSILLGTFACLIFVAPGVRLIADEPAQKEHAAAETDHVKWLKQLREMRIEHQHALAALKRLEAEILDHEAELEEQIAEIEEHREHIAEHEAALAGGKGKSTEEEHAEIEKQHAKIAKAMESAHKDHKDLISGLMKFVKGHLEKFHAQHD